MSTLLVRERVYQITEEILEFSTNDGSKIDSLYQKGREIREEGREERREGAVS
jgi:hypothetical protein